MESTANLILIADDDPNIRRLLSATLGGKDGFQLVFATDGTEALEVARNLQPQLILLDVSMPGLSGLEVCQRLKQDVEVFPGTRPKIVLLTGMDSEAAISEGMLAGADGYFVKPFSPTALLKYLRQLLSRASNDQNQNTTCKRRPELSVVRRFPEESTDSVRPQIPAPSLDLSHQLLYYARDLHQAHTELQSTIMGTLKAMVTAIDARDKHTNRHSERVGAYAQIMMAAIQPDPESLEIILHAGLLHDLGKIGIPDRILHKKSSLNAKEWAIMKQHPQLSWDTLHDLPFLQPALPAILYHHERYDGNGYPFGLTGPNIPCFACIISVADAFDAMTTDRAYRSHLSIEQARAEVIRNRGTQFSPSGVEVFCDAFDKLAARAVDFWPGLRSLQLSG